VAVVVRRDDHVPVADALFVVVSGPPASGKSTLAPALARDLALPLVAKDTIKDALMSALPVPDVATSREIGRAAIAAMLAVAAESPIGAVVESNFSRSVAVEDLGRLPGLVVEVFCRCSRATAMHRYAARAGTRHVGHFDGIRSGDELWNDQVAEPVAGDWPLLEVNTEEPVDVVEVVAFIRSTTWTS
jgi:predicted kinase